MGSGGVGARNLDAVALLTSHDPGHAARFRASSTRAGIAAATTAPYTVTVFGICTPTVNGLSAGWQNARAVSVRDVVEGLQLIDRRSGIGDQFQALIDLVNRAGFALVPVRNLRAGAPAAEISAGAAGAAATTTGGAAGR